MRGAEKNRCTLVFPNSEKRDSQQRRQKKVPGKLQVTQTVDDHEGKEILSGREL